MWQLATPDGLIAGFKQCRVQQKCLAVPPYKYRPNSIAFSHITAWIWRLQWIWAWDLSFTGFGPFSHSRCILSRLNRLSYCQFEKQSPRKKIQKNRLNEIEPKRNKTNARGQSIVSLHRNFDIICCFWSSCWILRLTDIAFPEFHIFMTRNWQSQCPLGLIAGSISIWCTKIQQ